VIASGRRQKIDARERIAKIFDRLVQLGRNALEFTSSERIVYLVVATRCESDINGFASVYEQHLVPEGIEILIDGLDQINERSLADEFQRGYDVLKSGSFYEHMNWNLVSDTVKSESAMIVARIGKRLWGVDEKLSSLLT
jgi:hypothetical protein